MQHLTPLLPGHTYHIFTRGNNRENLFREERNYQYFLALYTKHICPIADTFAYCLMRNHLHLLIRISETAGTLEQTSPGKMDMQTSVATHAFSNLLNAYAKAINKAYGRTGRLFEEHFGRIEVDSDSYFTSLIFYIHFNPQKHGFVSDFRIWPWSSYGALISSKPTHLCRAMVLEWFGGVTRLSEFHAGVVDERAINTCIEDDE
jgi:REP element-mobilizing transposase RayT